MNQVPSLANPTPLKFAGSYRYAQANGYEGSHGQYIDLQYKVYADSCARCQIEPAPFAQWYAAQVH